MGHPCLINIVDTREFKMGKKKTKTGNLPALTFSSSLHFVLEKAIMSLPIPPNGPKVTAMLWNGLDTQV
jgi:hypothetical protein